MHDALMRVIEIVQAHAEIAAVLPQRFNLLSRDNVLDRKVPIDRGHVVVLRCDGQLRLADFAASDSKSFERLRAGDFVDQVQIDVEHRLFAGFVVDHMLVPDFFEQSLRGVGDHCEPKLKNCMVRSGRLPIEAACDHPIS